MNKKVLKNKNIIIIVIIIIIAIITILLINLSNNRLNNTINHNNINNTLSNDVTTSTRNDVYIKGMTVNGDTISLPFDQKDVNRFKYVKSNVANKYYQIDENDIKYNNATSNETTYLLYNIDSKKITYLLKFSVYSFNLIQYDSYNLINESKDLANNKVSWEFKTAIRKEYLYVQNFIPSSRLTKYQSATHEDFDFVQSIIEGTSTENIAIFNIDNM